MGGAACTIIILGNQLKGDTAGLYELLAETDLAASEDEKREVLEFLQDTKAATDDYLTSVKRVSGADLNITVAGILLDGNLGAICDSAVDSQLSEEVKHNLAEYLEGRKRIAEKVLEKFRKRAEKGEY